MDPLSIAASIAGLITLVQSTFSWAQDFSHEPSERQAFLARFERIRDDLASLRDRLQVIGEQYAVDTQPEERIIPVQHEVTLFARAREMGNPGGDLEQLTFKIKAIYDRASRVRRSKLEELEDRSLWIWKKAGFANEQRDILDHLRHMRDKLSDDDAKVNYQTNLLVRDLHDRKEFRKIVKILDWICPEPLSDPAVAAPTVVTSSLTFVRTDSIFKRWYEDAKWQLNCYGAPGSGKSVRAQAVLNSLKQKPKEDFKVVLSLFFYRGNEARQSEELVIRSLLRQVITCRKPVQIPSAITEQYESDFVDGKLNTGLELDTARTFLYESLASASTKYLVIDAVDEADGCEPSKLDKEIKTLRHKGVCIFSTDQIDTRVRYDQVICFRCHKIPLELYWQCKACAGFFRAAFDICEECYVEKGLRCNDPSHAMSPPLKVNVAMRADALDVEGYVRRFLAEEFDGGDTGDDDDMMFVGKRTLLAALREELGEEFWSSIPAKIRNAASGNYLYAQIFLKRLSLQRTVEGAILLARQLEKGQLTDIDESYRDMLALCLNEADEDSARTATLFLGFTASSFDVLKFDQLAHAIAIKPSSKKKRDFAKRLYAKDKVRRDTHGLLSIENSEKANSFPVGFFHTSLTDYINRVRDQRFPDSYQQMFDACLSYLGLDIFAIPFDTLEQLEKAVEDYPFVSYAACYWGLHARDVTSNARNSLRIFEFLTDQQRLNCAMQIAWHTQSRADSSWDVAGGVTALHACSFFGLVPQCRAVLTSLWAVDIGDEEHNQTALMYACRNGHSDVVLLLLKAGADPNHISRLGETPLLTAIVQDHENVFDTLLSCKDLQVNLLPLRHGSRTPLVRAAECGRSSMLKKLLAHRSIEVNKSDGIGRSALSRAVQMLKVDCVSLLLADDRIDLTLRDSQGRTALDWTAEHSLNYERDHEIITSVTRMLLDDRRKPKIPNTAVFTAIEGEKLELLKVFIEYRLDSTYRDELGRDFLHLAAFEGHCDVVELIHRYFSAQRSFDINKRLDVFGATALHLACRQITDAHLETIKFLLHENADPTIQDSAGLTPLQQARNAAPGRWTTQIRPLFETLVPAYTLNESTPQPPTIKSLVQLGALEALKMVVSATSAPLDPETDPYTLCSILHLTMDLPDDVGSEVLRILLPHCHLFLNATNRYQRSCIHVAVLENANLALKILLEMPGVDLNIRDRWGLTAFELGQMFLRHELCVLLVKSGAKLPPADQIRPELLHAAVETGEVIAVQKLIDTGMDLYFRDPVTRVTSLQRAEYLRDDILQDVNDELLTLVTPSNPMELTTFKKAKLQDPRVQRREQIVKCLEDAEQQVTRARKQTRKAQDWSQLMNAVRELKPDQNIEDIVKPKTERGNSADSLPSYEDATRPESRSGKPMARENSGMIGISNTLVDASPHDRDQRRVVWTVGPEVFGMVLSITIGIVAIVWLLVQREAPPEL